MQLSGWVELMHVCELIVYVTKYFSYYKLGDLSLGCKIKLLLLWFKISIKPVTAGGWIVEL